MDFKDQIKQLSERVEKLKENIQTEEATKNAFVMPFIQSLGYDVFNPLEVVPEFTCDIGTKKGEKIDYAIMKDGSPSILIECKHWSQELSLHDNQLLRYFHVSTAKFGILTNGIQYRFYTDLETPNKMDEKPFLQVDIVDLKDGHIDEIKKFHKSYFDIDNILSSASELKYTRELKHIIGNEFNNPSPEFVKLFSRQVYDGMITSKLLDQFTSLLKKSIHSYINDQITDRLKSALSSTDEKSETGQTEQVKQEPEDDGIVTTVEEMEGYMIVKSILRQNVEPSRIMYKDTRSYFAIMLDNQRKTVCRLYFNGKQKFVTTMDENKKEIRFDIGNLDDIYVYSDEIINSLNRALNS